MDEETKKQIANEVTQQVLDSIEEHVIPAVEKSIRSTVNGKIDSLSKEVKDYDKKVDEHLDFFEEEVRPFLQGWYGAKRIGNTLKWIAGVVIAVAGAVAVIVHIGK